MATEFKVAWGLEENLPESYVPGRLLVTTDTKTIQLDIGEAERILLGQNLNLQNGTGERSLQQSLDEDASWITTNDEVINTINNNESNQENDTILVERDNNGNIVKYITFDEGETWEASAEGTNPKVLAGALGQSSVSEGGKSQALGARSHTEGNRTIAFDRRAHAEGNQTFAKGQHSHAEGNKTSALGKSSHSEGWESIASVDYAHAEGYWTTAKGFEAHAEGKQSLAEGEASHAEGGETKATNLYAHAEGYRTQANGDSAHAEGADTEANGDHSHAEGKQSVAEGVQSHAGGWASKAAGARSFTHGNQVRAWGDDQFIIGQFNDDSDKESVFIIGGGSSTEDKRNIFTIDKNGNAYSNDVKLQLDYQELDISSYEGDDGQYLINWLNSKEALVNGKYKTIDPDDNFIYFIDIIEYNKNIYQTFLDGDEHIRYERWVWYDNSDNEYAYGEWSIIADSALATGSTPGLVKIGAGLNIDDTGMLSTTEASDLFSMPYVVVTKDGTKESKGKIRVWAYNLQSLTTYKILLYTRSRRRGTHQGNWIPAKDLGYAKLAGKHVSDIQPDPDDDTTWPTYEAIDTVTMPWFNNNNGYVTSEWIFTTLDNETTYNFEISVIEHLIKPLLKPSYSYDETTQTIAFDWSRCGIIGMRKSSIAPLLFQFKIQQDSTIYENYRYPSTLAVGINSKVLKKLNENVSTPIKNITVNPTTESGITSDQLYISIR